MWAFFWNWAHPRLYLVQVLLPLKPTGCKALPTRQLLFFFFFRIKTILFRLPSFSFFFSCSLARCFSLIYLFIYLFPWLTSRQTHPVEYYCLRHPSIHPLDDASPSLLILLPTLTRFHPHTPPNVPPIFRIPTKI